MLKTSTRRGGIVIQLAVMVLYSLVLLEFAVRYITRRPAPRMINLIGCCCFRWARAEPKVRSHAPPTKEASGADSPPDSAPAAEPYTGRNKNIKYLLSLCSFTTLLLFIRCGRILGQNRKLLTDQIYLPFHRAAQRLDRSHRGE